MAEPENSGPQYVASVWQSDSHSPLLRHVWENLVSTRETPGAVYQTPAFYDYLRDAERDSVLDVLTIKDERAGAIVGVIPIKLSKFDLSFTFGSHTLLALKSNSLSILGSEPMIPERPEAFDELFVALLRHFPEADVIYMDALSSESNLWRHLQNSPTIRRLYHVHPLYGFRECHSVPVPASVENYYQKLHRKKRYNLVRQQRILEKVMGHALELVVVNDSSNLPILFDAIEKLVESRKEHSISTNEQYSLLASRGFVHCYVLKAGDKTIGCVLGTKSGKIYRLHKFFHDKSLEKYSPGTALWQLVLKDLILKAEFTSVDMGYGTPVYRFRATNVIEQKGRILLFRRSTSNRLRILAHSGYCAVVDFVKSRLGRDSRSE